MSAERWSALEADLLAAGFVLDDYPDRLTLRAMVSAMKHASPGSAVYRLEKGPKADWGYTQELLAGIMLVLQAANWQRAGNRTAPQPKPLTRPGDLPERARQITGEVMSIAEFRKRWRGG